MSNKIGITYCCVLYSETLYIGHYCYREEIIKLTLEQKLFILFKFLKWILISLYP